MILGAFSTELTQSPFVCAPKYVSSATASSLSLHYNFVINLFLLGDYGGLLPGRPNEE
jgi:hypothetical protein